MPTSKTLDKRLADDFSRDSQIGNPFFEKTAGYSPAVILLNPRRIR